MSFELILKLIPCKRPKPTIRRPILDETGLIKFAFAYLPGLRGQRACEPVVPHSSRRLT